MKITINIFAIMLLFFSCKKILNTSPTDFIEEKDYYTTLSQITGALAAVYDPLFGQSNAMFGLYYQAVLTIQADEMYNRNTNPTSTYALTYNGGDYTNAIVSNFWNACYRGIERANVLLANIDNAKNNVDSADFNAVKGEALFLRGFYHFVLVQNFGGVPIKITPTAGVSDVNRARNTVAEVYDQIIKDMTAADSLVYPTYSQFSGSSSRVIKTVVDGMLARVYLYMAGYPLKDQSMYAQSLNWSNKVIESGLHSLNTSYEDNPLNIRGSVGDSLMYFASNGNPGYVNNPYSQVFLYESKAQYFTQENMWESDVIGNVAYSETTNIGSQYGGPQCGSNYNVLGRVSNQALTTYGLYKSYQTGDLRRDWNCAPYSWSSATEPIRTFTSTSISNLNGRPLGKWRREYEPFATGYTAKTSWGTSIKFPLLRYADVLLMNAEAEIHVSGVSDAAIDKVNQIRRRAFGIVNGTSPIKSIKISSGGTGYTTAPTIIISGNGKAKATATVSKGIVTAITITNAGIGYSEAPTITFSGGGGSGATAVASLYDNSDVDLKSSITIDDLQDSIAMERYREFAGEGLRKADLIRWGKYLDALGNLRDLITSSGISLTSGGTVRIFTLVANTIAGGTKFLLLPIPSSELIANKLMTQNPGW